MNTKTEKQESLRIFLSIDDLRVIYGKTQRIDGAQLKITYIQRNFIISFSFFDYNLLFRLHANHKLNNIRL